MANVLQVGVSALMANQSGLRTVGHNISNTNTEGYSRQQVAFETRMPDQLGRAGYMGNGVTIGGVRRIVDEFIGNELNLASNNFYRLDTIHSNSKQLDELLGDSSTALTPSLRNFFEAIQSAAETSPTSVANRQLLLSEAGLLVNRLSAIQERLNGHNSSLNLQIESVIESANAAARQVAALNEKISFASSQDEFSQPNDLLDKRDQMIADISSMMDISLVEEDNGSINVFVGSGQGLVIGNRVFALGTENNESDSSRLDVTFEVSGNSANISENISGGELGGLLEFRSDVLDQVYNRLGVITTGLMVAVNEQHQRGLDLDNQLGGNFFSDVNNTSLMRRRSQADQDNTLPRDRVIEVAIDEVDELQPSDYLLKFSPSDATQYTITRLSDEQVVANNVLSGVFPSTTEFDGLRVDLISGSFSAGDVFRLVPFRNMAAEIDVTIANVNNIALAQPIRTSSSSSNLGTSNISQGVVLDTATTAFDSANNALLPPLLIEFISSNRYDVLDNSDPSNPVNLVPPLVNRQFIPGITNSIFSEDEHQTGLTSAGSAIGQVQLPITGNAYPAETLEFTTVDPDTNVITRQLVNTVLNDSAETTAQAIDVLAGVSATARNFATISNITSVSPMTLTFNGELLTGTDANALSDSINSNTALSALGISAKSDGTTISVRANTGVDFTFQVGGGAPGDSVTVTTEDGIATAVTGAFASPAITFGGKIDVFMGENVSLRGGGALFDVLPTALSTYRGYQVEIDGLPVTGDRFTIDYNTDGHSDNRNAVALAELQTRKILYDEEQTLQEGYTNLVNVIGTKTHEIDISREAAESILIRVKADRDNIAGVNMDEEAVLLMQFEQAYNAAAQLISIARTTFDTLIGATGG